MDLLEALLALSEGATGQLAALVGHEVAALCERQVLQVQDLTGAQLVCAYVCARACVRVCVCVHVCACACMCVCVLGVGVRPGVSCFRHFINLHTLYM